MMRNLMSWLCVMAALFSGAADGQDAKPSEKDGSLLQKTIFKAGKGGYHTYRIPAILVTQKGTALAFCEGRKNSGSDIGNIDLVLRTSRDGGVTWDAMRVIHDDGENTIGNPCPILDRDTGVVWLLFCRNNQQVFVTSSSDDGQTWAAPAEITKDVKPADWGWYATGPCHGIQLRSGRMLAPCDHKVVGPAPNHRYSHVIYSDDHGKTWKLGGSLPDGTDECVAVEGDDGAVYLNTRGDHKNGRAVAWSRDGGLTWSEVRHDAVLQEPVCQGSAVRLTGAEKHGKSRILFSNPGALFRVNMTVRLSYDGCQTWAVSRSLWEGPSAYSDLCVLPDMKIGCLYERGKWRPYETITFALFDLPWLTAGKDEIAGK